MNERNQAVRVGGVKYTIKDGIVYDARKLLADVRRIVREAKEKTGKDLAQPGLPAPAAAQALARGGRLTARPAGSSLPHPL